MTDKSHWLPLSEENVRRAYSLIEPHVHTTPVLTSKTLNRIASSPQSADALADAPSEQDQLGARPAHPRINLFFKCENYQRIGAFKVRGAFHAVLRLLEERGEEEVRRKGVITHSSGSNKLNLHHTPYLVNPLLCIVEG